MLLFNISIISSRLSLRKIVSVMLFRNRIINSGFYNMRDILFAILSIYEYIKILRNFKQ